ncbi:hypothetical protein CIL03_13835 [Virgibacillus indicus]|uniref:Uncharacterized protein n=1 Tax=Virgibacillus indicus TaxID=2024554 RepID=A0A265N8P7_9BACI|nr:hypothetical protein CIL03_13835 [Virgibacillus indicus]
MENILNFYIDNGYVANKKKWVKPFHSTFEANNKLLHGNFNDCVSKHKEVLMAVKKTYMKVKV